MKRESEYKNPGNSSEQLKDSTKNNEQSDDIEREKFPERPKAVYPELLLGLEILEKKLVRYTKEKWGVSVKGVNVKKLIGLVEGYEQKFIEEEKFTKRLGEFTELPDDDFMKKKIQVFLSQIESVLKEKEILPENFEHKKQSNLPVSVEYLPDYPLQGHYINHDVLHMFGYGKDNKKSLLRIGGKRLLPFATDLRIHGAKIGTKLSMQQSLDLVLAHIVAHEYGHYLERLYEDKPMQNTQFVARAEQVSSNPLVITDPQEREEVHSERFSQSVANVLVKELLSEMGFEPAPARQLAMHIGSLNISRIQGYKKWIEWGNRNGLTSHDVTTLLLKARVALREAGRDDLAESVEYSWRSAGYYLPIYDEKKLKYIITGKVSK